MSISNEISRIERAKQRIKDAIIAQGIDVSDNDTISSFPDKIKAINSNGGSEGANVFRISPCNFTTFTTDTAIHIRIGEFIADV